MDLDRDLFRIAPDGRGPSTDEVLAAVRDLGYEPSVADPGTFRPASERTHPTGDAPDLVRRACERARAEGKLVLVDCMGDN